MRQYLLTPTDFIALTAKAHSLLQRDITLAHMTLCNADHPRTNYHRKKVAQASAKAIKSCESSVTTTP
jgi:hypothetical protein